MNSWSDPEEEADIISCFPAMPVISVLKAFSVFFRIAVRA